MENKKIKDFTPEERKEYNRLRKQKQREREKQTSEKYLAELEENEEREIYNTRNLCFFGEQAPGVDAKDQNAELQIHREFLRGLDQPDVQPGETLRQVAERTFSAWLNQTISWMCTDDKRVPNPPDNFLMSFNRKEQKFNGLHGFDGSKLRGVPFEEIWRPPADCTGDEAIDVSALPSLPHRQPKQPEQFEFPAGV